MCPACIAITVIITACSASAGGLSVVAFNKARSDKKTDDRRSRDAASGQKSGKKYQYNECTAENDA